MPRLIHPVPISIQQFNLSATIQDEDYREPVQQAARGTTVEAVGQVAWSGDKELEFTRGGVQEKANGYVLFRYRDLNAKSITLKDNDRFISIGGIETDVYIAKLLPIGHYTDQGGPTMVKAFFIDRQPSRQGRAT